MARLPTWPYWREDSRPRNCASRLVSCRIGSPLLVRDRLLPFPARRRRERATSMGDERLRGEASHLMSTARLQVTHYSDPGCRWAYSASPALAVLRWRYGDQLTWRNVVIGLTEDAQQYVRRGYTPVRSAIGYQRFRRFGMPFAVQPRARVVATSRACRTIVAVRRAAPDRELAAFRALQFAWFTTPLLLDEDQAIAAALETVPGIDAAA